MEELYGFTETRPGARLEKDVGGQTLVVDRLTRPAGMRPYLELLNRVWGFSDRDSIPLHEIVVSVMCGGLFLGMSIGNEPAGVVQVMPAFSKEHGFHHHSNFMGFPLERRSRGLGLEAKRAHAVLAARERVKLVTWTFDPLQAANANLNFRKLGGVCRAYLDDQYGGMGGEFDSGLPTDRMLVEWRIDTNRVRERLRGRMPSCDDLAKRFEDAPRLSAAGGGDPAFEPGPPALLLAAPAGLHELARTDLEAARRELSGFKQILTRLLGAGYMVTEMIRSGVMDQNNYYVLEKEVRSED